MKKYIACLFLFSVASFAYAIEEKQTLDQICQKMMRAFLTSKKSNDNSTDKNKNKGMFEQVEKKIFKDTGISIMATGQNHICCIKKFEYVSNEESKRIHQIVLAQAPEKIKIILEARKLDWLKSNWLFLYGTPETGKLILAEAMGYYWGKCFIVSASNIIDDNCRITHDRLNYLFNQIARDPGRKTLIIDDINKLADYYMSKNTDANEISAASFWDYFGHFRSDRDFFLIGTTNEIQKLTPQLQDRFEYMTIEVTDNNCDRQMIEYNLNILGILKSPSFDEQSC
ncbi:MAG: ATP-binding protein [bacterium]|nr:ATP-binding protein [bacterium]